MQFQIENDSFLAQLCFFSRKIIRILIIILHAFGARLHLRVVCANDSTSRCEKEILAKRFATTLKVYALQRLSAYFN